MYNKPIVENKSTAEFFASMFKPGGPMITPDIISPIIPGIFSLLSKIGDSSMMNNTNEKTSTGFFSGN